MRRIDLSALFRSKGERPTRVFSNTAHPYMRQPSLHGSSFVRMGTNLRQCKPHFAFWAELTQFRNNELLFSISHIVIIWDVSRTGGKGRGSERNLALTRVLLIRDTHHVSIFSDFCSDTELQWVQDASQSTLDCFTQQFHSQPYSLLFSIFGNQKQIHASGDFCDRAWDRKQQNSGKPNLKAFFWNLQPCSK